MAHHQLGTIRLPSGMVWTDEFDWCSVERATTWSINGALLIDVGVRQAGRPITLSAQDDQGWIRRETLRQLQHLADTEPDAEHTLTLADGRVFRVRFAQSETSPITATALGRPELPPAHWPYITTLRLIEV